MTLTELEAPEIELLSVLGTAVKGLELGFDNVLVHVVIAGHMASPWRSVDGAIGRVREFIAAIRPLLGDNAQELEKRRREYEDIVMGGGWF
ncbi:MAG: hypothetical protein ACI9C1_003160 [Candidatus Aldehydirespiratoraceae bacterium]|jgi:hypothetical protein